MTYVKCPSCGGTYQPIQPSGTYAHVCPPDITERQPVPPTLAITEVREPESIVTIKEPGWLSRLWAWLSSLVGGR